MFHLQQYEVRVRLLYHFDAYVDSLIEYDSSIMEDILLLELFKGLEEAEDGIYFPSIFALCLLIPKYFRSVNLSYSVNTRDSIADISRATKVPILRKQRVEELIGLFVIPHAINACLSVEKVTVENFWLVIDSLILLWKSMALMSGQKVNLI